MYLIRGLLHPLVLFQIAIVLKIIFKKKQICIVHFIYKFLVIKTWNEEVLKKEAEKYCGIGN